MGFRRPLKRVPRERAPRKGAARATFRAHPNTPPPPAPPLQSALVALGCALLRRAVCACAEGPHPAAKEECARDAGARPRAHAHPACRTAATSGRRPAAKRTRTALCATPGGAPGTAEADPPAPPRRVAVREPAPVGDAAGGGAPRAAAGAHSTLCVAHSAAGNASQAGVSEPLDALSLAQRQAMDAPHRRTPTERTGPRACAHNAP